MPQFNAINSRSPGEARLPRRDWILLPLLGLLTICLAVGSAEFVARRVFAESRTGVASCMVRNDPATGPRGIPNSVCWEKAAESPAVEFKLNSCGHRAGTECGSKPQGSFRIVMIGSSVALGVPVQRESTIAALLPAELSQKTRHRIEIYNEGMLSEHPRVVAQRFGEVLNAEPDMILWELTPYDLKAVSFLCDGCDSEKPPVLDASAGQAGTFARAWYRLKIDLASHGIMSELCQRTGFSPDRDPVGIMLLHFLYRTQKQAIESYLMTPDEESGYLKEELSTVWQDRLQLFDTYVAAIEQRARSGSVPLVVTFVPDRAQAAMISRGEWPKGYNPYKLNNEIRSIVTSRGAMYIDILPDFRAVPNPEQGYFPVDRHPNADGHAMISHMLAKELTSGVIPELRADGRRAAVATSK